MKLNMSIYLDWLKNYHTETMIRSDRFEIETVRLFSKEQELKDNTLYVGRMSELFSVSENKVICVHKNDIIIVDTDDLQAVFNEMLNAKDYYEEWNASMMSLLAGESVLQDLFDLSEDKLKYPICLLDVGQRKQAVSYKYIPDSDPLWEQMLDEGAASTETLIHINTSYPDRTRKKDFYQLDKSFFPHDAYHKNFFLNEEYIGCALLLDTDGKLSPGVMSLFSILCDYIDRWYQIHIQNQESIQLKTLIKDAISTEDYDFSELHYLLSLRDWHDDDRLMLLQLISSYEKFNFNTHMCQMLESHFPMVIAVTLDKSICVLCNVSKMPWQKLKDEMLPWIKGSRYYASVSPDFNMTEPLYEYFQYTELTLEYCGKEPGTYYDGKNILFKHMMHHFQQHTLMDIRHHAYMTLKAYDEQHQTQLNQTLYTFLKLERNHTEVARQLNMHRNSLDYRLKQIKNISDFQFDDYYERMLFLLSFEMEQTINPPQHPV